MSDPNGTWPPARVEVHGNLATVDPDPDLDLLQAWRNGDKKAASQLLARHYDSIRRQVATKVPESEVDDLVQRVIVALLEGRETFRGDAKFKTYAMKVTLNVIADFFRRRRPTSSLDALEVSVSDHGVGPSTLLDGKTNQRLLLEALRSIELGDQFLLELHYWEKMTGPQLAQVYECSEAAIRSRLRRARERLRAQVTRIAQDERELADTLTDLDSWAMKLREALAERLGRPR